MRCPSCGNENREGARFCDSCGSELTPQTAVPEARPEQLPADVPSRDRRPLPGAALPRAGRAQARLPLRRHRHRHARSRSPSSTPRASAPRSRPGPGARRRRCASSATTRTSSRVLDTGEDGGNPFIVSELHAGRRRRGPARRGRRGGSTVERAVEIAADVSRALEHAHSRGIVHRDLKPANVWIDDDGARPARRLRPGDDRGPRPGERRDAGRHRRLPAARAGARRGRRPEERPLLARRAALRDAHRPAAVPGRRRGLDHLPAPARGPGAPVAPQPDGSRGARRAVLRLLAKRPEDRPATPRRPGG